MNRIVLTLAIGVCILLSAACGGSANDDTSISEGHGTVEHVTVDPLPGSGSPPVESRILASDAVVRATLSSTTSTSLRFTVLEYLKGTGPSSITVTANPNLRNTGHDNREAVLFLRRTSSDGLETSDASDGEFVFSDAHSHDLGYTVDTLDPAWLPTEARVGETSDSSSEKVFITDSGTATGGIQETITLADLRSKIAWVDGGQNIAGYTDCIVASLNELRYHRNYQAYYGEPWPTGELGTSLASGMGIGTVVNDGGVKYAPGYNKVWLTGRDAAYFNALIVDDNKIASDGSYERVATARPLPASVYRFRDHILLYEYMPCNFTPGTGQLDWVVTVTAPAGTLHEAFFDPVESGEDEVSPASFSVGGTDTEIKGLEWADGKVVLSLDPVVSLDGYTLDFIELDGTASLNLRGSDGIGEGASISAPGDAGTLTWSVSDEPWEPGDKLMLRIREDSAPPPPTPTPSNPP